MKNRPLRIILHVKTHELPWEHELILPLPVLSSHFEFISDFKEKEKQFKAVRAL